MNQNDRLFHIFIILLIILNIFFLSYFGRFENRCLRIFGTLLFFVPFLINKNSRKKKRLTIAFSFLLLSDVAMLFYEDFAFICLGAIAIAYLFLLLQTWPKIKTAKSTWIDKMIFLGILILNAWFFYSVLEMAPNKIKTGWEAFIFSFVGLEMVLLVISAITYNNCYSNKASFYFTCLALGLTFSHVTSVIAYYLEFPEFYYANSFFYILALFCVFKFSTLKNEEGMLRKPDCV